MEVKVTEAEEVQKIRERFLAGDVVNRIDLSFVLAAESSLRSRLADAEQINAAIRQAIVTAEIPTGDTSDLLNLMHVFIEHHKDKEKRLAGAEERGRLLKGDLDEYRDKASVASHILKQYRDNSGLPLERSITAGQLIGTFAQLEAKCRAEHDSKIKNERRHLRGGR